ncbi:hypothetical protein M3J09_007020 [Ascochyta lentis]
MSAPLAQQADDQEANKEANRLARLLRTKGCAREHHGSSLVAGLSSTQLPGPDWDVSGCNCTLRRGEGEEQSRRKRSDVQHV